MSKEQEYHPLISDPADDIDADPSPLGPSSWTARWTSKITRGMLAGLLTVETVALVISIVTLFKRVPHPTCTVPASSQRVLYSPALSAVEHEVQVYNVGFTGDLSPFQRPSSPKLDQMWSDLYNFGISRITKEEAAQLPNKTHAIPGDPGHYIAELDVFHNLHCLNKVRMALDPDYYPDWRISTTNNHIPSQKNATEHVGHCIDWIRQSIMCTGDTSVIVWQWENWVNASIVKGNVAHTCRKFDKLQEWAKDRMLLKAYDPTVHIEDDIVDRNSTRPIPTQQNSDYKPGPISPE
ncbi:hypothetical protein GGX14DRAFT_570934 [Mycena pura]|uniref:Tat pathway signal sequence n=1 Tax=Mycena pura TaxID=153505 RepID=A0AAD6Y575_9AGAR|nr:hypothetical protein GGX14DRAFT_570934 [Mycena pura]